MVDTPAPRWEIDLGFGPIHAVEMDPPSAGWGRRSFRVDGTEHSVGMSLRLSQVAEFAIDGHRCKLSTRLVRPTIGYALRRAFHDEVLRSSSEPWSSQVTLAACELAVDERSRGTWVATTVGAELRGWTYVEPGGAVPSSATEEWVRSHAPVPPPVRSEEDVAMPVAVGRAGRREGASFAVGVIIGAVAFGAAAVASIAAVGSDTGTGNDAAWMLLMGALLAAGLVAGLITVGDAGYAGAAVGFAGACLALATYGLGTSPNPSEDFNGFTILVVPVGIGLAIVLAGAFVGRRLRGVAALLRRGEGAASGNPRRS